MKNETSLPRVDKVDSSPALRTHGNGRTELKLADPAQADLADLETATIDLPADANGDFDPPNGHNDTDASCLSENRPRKGGQAHFAPRAPQNEPVPAGSRIGSRPESRVPVVEAAEIASGSRRARPARASSFLARWQSSCACSPISACPPRCGICVTNRRTTLLSMAMSPISARGSTAP